MTDRLDPMVTVARRTEYADTTRRALLDSARALFAEKGYQNTSLDDVANAARVTKGALYHHFAGKKELFEAVVRELEDEVLARAGESALSTTDAWEAFMTGVDRYLDACLEGDVQRILLLDAPTVLGWEQMREIGCGIDLTKKGLARAIKAHEVKDQPVEPLAHIIVGAIIEAALYIAKAEDSTAAREEMGRTIRRMLEGIK